MDCDNFASHCFGASSSEDDTCDLEAAPDECYAAPRGYGALPAPRMTMPRRACRMGSARLKACKMELPPPPGFCAKQRVEQQSVVIRSWPNVPFFASAEAYSVKYKLETLEHYQKLTVIEAAMPLVQIEASMGGSRVAIVQNVAFSSLPEVEAVFEHRTGLDNAEVADDECVYHVVKRTEGTKVLRGVDSPADVMTLMQADGDQIVRLMASWEQKDGREKMCAIQTFGCYELYVYVKLHDPDFFEEYLREYV